MPPGLYSLAILESQLELRASGGYATLSGRPHAGNCGVGGKSNWAKAFLRFDSAPVRAQCVPPAADAQKIDRILPRYMCGLTTYP